LFLACEKYLSLDGIILLVEQSVELFSGNVESSGSNRTAVADTNLGDQSE
jgi:hypothetical protein